MSDATPTSPPPPPKRKRRFRWYTRLLIIVVSLVLAIVVIAQILFWTDYPRQIVQSQIGGILHVNAKLGSLKIGWLGDVAVRDLSLQLPTESEPFLTVERADLKLAALPLLIVDQEVHRLAASGVDLRVREVAPGRFNLQQLLPPGSPEPASPSQPTDPAKILAQLPSVSLDRVKASVTRLNGKTLAFDDVRATLNTDRPLTRTFTASVDDVAKVDGKVAVLSSAPHEVNVTLDRVPSGLAEFIGAEIPAASAQLHWKGRVTSDGVTGSLVIDRAAAENLAAAAGQIDLATQQNAIIVRPVGLTLTVAPDAATTRPTTDATTQPATKPAGPIVLKLNAGTIRAADQFRVESLRGTLDLGDAKAGHFALDGTFDPASFDGDLNAAWDSLTRAAIATTGTLHATSKRDFTGKLIAAANVETSVTLPSGTATAKLDVNAAGEALDDAVVDLHLAPLGYAAAGKAAPIVGPELRGRIVARGSVVELTQLRTVGDASAGTLLVRGRADRGQGAWPKADAWLTVDARQLALPLLESFGVRGPIDADGNFWREGNDFVVDSLYARWNGATLWSRGAYRTLEPKPLLLDTWAWYPATAVRPTLDPDEISVGDLVARGTVGGTLGGPLGGQRYVEATLNVVGNDVSIQHQPIGDVTVDVVASLDEDSVDVHSREIALFGGNATLAGTYLLSGSDPLRATLDLKGLDVAKLAQAGGVDGARGTIDEGHFNIEAPPTFTLADIHVDGQVRGTSLAKDTIEAETLTASLDLTNNTLRVVPILRQGEGTLDAELVADVTLAKPATLAFDLKNWPAPAAAATTRAATQAAPDEPAATRPVVNTRATAKGTATALIRDVPSTQPVLFPPIASATQPAAPPQPPPSTKRLETTLQMDASVDRGDQTLATLTLGARSTGAIFALDSLDVKTLDGTLVADARIDLDDVNGATLNARFDRLAPSTLAWVNPLIGEVRGRFSGDVTVKPADGPRPLGRIEITANVAPTPDAGFRSVAVGPITFHGFGDVESADKYRVVTDAVEVHVADGVVKPFARYSYDAAVGPSQLVTVKFENLDIDQLTRVAIDDGQPIVGRLGGKLRVFGPARTLDTINGEADVEITQSDLANFKPVAALYDIMNIGRAGKQPVGTGNISARIEAGTLTLVDATYFNRGVFANAFGDVKEVAKLNEAPLDLYLLGSAQPLKQSGSGFLSQVFGTANDYLAALQGSLTTVHVTGTLKKPKIEQAAFGELGGTLQALIVGKSK